MRGGRRLRRGGLLLALAALGAACGVSEKPIEAPPPEATPTMTQAPASTPTAVSPTLPPAPTPGATPTPTPAPYDGEVVGMRLPSLGVDAPIERIGLVEGRNQLDVPEWYNVGWYEIYDKPGFGTSSLFSAHKDYYPDKRGPFYALTDLSAGDQIIVVMDDGREYVYEVFLQRRYEAPDFPVGDLIRSHKAEDPTLRRPPEEEWIALYTCGGEFTSSRPGGPGSYIHRDLVVGRLVRTNPPPPATEANQR